MIYKNVTDKYIQRYKLGLEHQKHYPKLARSSLLARCGWSDQTPCLVSRWFKDSHHATRLGQITAMITYIFVSPSLNQENSPLNLQIKEQHASEGEARQFFLFISHGHLNCMLIVHRFKTLRIDQTGSVVVVGITHNFW